MASVDTALHQPAEGWDGPMAKQHRAWFNTFWLFAIVLAGISLAWFFVGKQNVPAQNMSMTPQEFQAQVDDFIAKHDPNGTGVVEVPPGEDAYLLSRMWSFSPVLKLKLGEKYTIWYSSMDVVHTPVIGGTPMNQRLAFQAIPGHVYGITVTPNKPGTYLIYCAEYCGLGHQNMATKLIVE